MTSFCPKPKKPKKPSPEWVFWAVNLKNPGKRPTLPCRVPYNVNVRCVYYSFHLPTTSCMTLKKKGRKKERKSLIHAFSFHQTSQMTSQQTCYYPHHLLSHYTQCIHYSTINTNKPKNLHLLQYSTLSPSQLEFPGKEMNKKNYLSL